MFRYLFTRSILLPGFMTDYQNDLFRSILYRQPSLRLPDQSSPVQTVMMIFIFRFPKVLDCCELAVAELFCKLRCTDLSRVLIIAGTDGSGQDQPLFFMKAGGGSGNHGSRQPRTQLTLSCPGVFKNCTIRSRPGSGPVQLKVMVSCVKTRGRSQMTSISIHPSMCANCCGMETLTRQMCSRSLVSKTSRILK